jgi:hypothetical protein
MRKEPGLRILPVLIHGFNRSSADLPSRPVERRDLPAAKRSSPYGGVKMRTPQNLICHPVADSGKAFLHQQDRLEWCAFASPEKSRYRVAIEGVGQNWRRQLCPPRGRYLSLVEQDSSQVPPIGKNQAPSGLAQDQQVVFPDFEQT